MIVSHCCSAALAFNGSQCYLSFVEGNRGTCGAGSESWGAISLFAFVVASSAAAQAGMLTPGQLLGPGSDAAAAMDGDSLSLSQFSASRDAAGISLQFTPRNPLTLLSPDSGPATAEPAELRLSVVHDEFTAVRFAALGSADSVPSSSQDGTGALEIGGALHWSDWTVGSGYARAPLFGGTADLVSATLG